MTSITDYHALRPWDYGPIVSLAFRQSETIETTDGIIEQELELVLSRRPDLSEDRLVLRFRGVRDLHFQQPTWSLAAFGAIELHECESGFMATEEEGLIRFRFKSLEARLDDSGQTRPK